MELVERLKNLRKSGVARIVKSRIREFENTSDLFGELCFCILTANFRADSSIEMQKKLRKEFLNASEEALAGKLRRLGHRFYNQRAKRIVLARRFYKEINKIREKDPFSARRWLIENICGIGMKESSHFLRNIGFKEVAIIDFHIINLLYNEGIISEKKRSLTSAKYLEIEKILRELATKTKLNLAELDLYLWYLETGRILK